jgi:hypothetical protein
MSSPLGPPFVMPVTTTMPAELTATAMGASKPGLGPSQERTHSGSPADEYLARTKWHVTLPEAPAKPAT